MRARDLHGAALRRHRQTSESNDHADPNAPRPRHRPACPDRRRAGAGGNAAGPGLCHDRRCRSRHAAGLGPKERGNQTIASPVQEAYPAEAVGDGNTAGGYNQSRWAEDWTRYRDPAKRNDPLDRLKFIPFDANGNVYLTLSGELRLRVNQTTNPNLRDAEAQRQDITRIVGGADLHLGRMSACSASWPMPVLPAATWARSRRRCATTWSCSNRSST